jgi:alkaline phosphatase
MHRFFTVNIFLFVLVFSHGPLLAQKIKYTTANAHAHNDYVHPLPFYTAYGAGFGSIEADVFLVDSQLFVAHTQKEITQDRTLQQLYLGPLNQKIKINNGHAYSSRHKKLLLLIDIKTEAISTIQEVVNVLQQYPLITGCKELKIVITGNQPEVSQLTLYPSWLYFDGNLNKSYTHDALKRIALFSDNLANYTKWNGVDSISVSDSEKIIAAVQKAHSMNKPIRFWGAPDNPKVWKKMMDWKLDYINTDQIGEITDFFKNIN